MIEEHERAQALDDAERDRRAQADADARRELPPPLGRAAESTAKTCPRCGTELTAGGLCPNCDPEPS